MKTKIDLNAVEWVSLGLHHCTKTYLDDDASVFWTSPNRSFTSWNIKGVLISMLKNSQTQASTK
jgi:hypothetical protein